MKLTLTLTTLLAATTAWSQITTTAAGLESPYKMTPTPAGNLLVGETGKTPRSGRITLVETATGRKTTLMSGLPSVSSAEGSESVTGLLLRGRTLYVLMGEGDVTAPGKDPGTSVPALPSSPIYSSLITIQLAAEPESITADFKMTAAVEAQLADGLDVELDNGAGAKATVRLLANFPDFTTDPIVGARASHVFGMDFAADNPDFLYVADASQNKLIRVDVNTGRTRTVVSFPPLRNTRGFGPPVSEVVPTNVRAYGADQLLVTYLGGFPFTPGASGVYIVDPKTGSFQPFIGGRTAVMDVIVRDNGSRPQFFVLEFSADLLAEPALPGGLVRYDTEAVAANTRGLITPVSMALDPRTGDIHISELGTGRIVKVAAASRP